MAQPIRRPTAGAIMRISSHQLRELRGIERLRAIRKRVIGIVVHFDEQSIGSGGYGGTSHRHNFISTPGPCEGSPTIGRCDSFLITGIAAISRVLRV